MTLTVTLSAGLAVDEGRAGARQLLAAAIGCNLAWGIIDAVMYMMNCITVRTGKRRLIDAVQRATNQSDALALIENEVEPEFSIRCFRRKRQMRFGAPFCRHIPRATRVESALVKEDVYGALACFGSCSFPACPPHCHFSSSPIRISRCESRTCCSIALLFLVGQVMGAVCLGTNRLAAGGAMVAIGLHSRRDCHSARR